MSNGLPALVLSIAFHILVALIAAWDIYMAATGRTGDSVSHIVQVWAKAFPVLPLVVGLVLGHLFWSQG